MAGWPDAGGTPGRGLLAALSFILGVAAGPLGAEADRVPRIGEAFEAWLARSGARGVIAVRPPGGTTEVLSFGLAAEAEAELASLSKAITAVCVLTLAEEGRLDLDAGLGAYVAGGPDISLGALMTHTGGIWTDMTQGAMPGWLGDGTARWRDVQAAVAARGVLGVKDGSTFHYSNENYALLGVAIEAVTQGGYEAVCRDRVLEPAGAGGRRSPETGAFLPWGGWRMTPADHVAVQAHWFGRDGAVGRDPFRYPAADLGGGAFYGPGTFVRDAGDGSAHFWHFGALCMPGRIETGSFAVTWFGHWHVFAAYDRCVGDDAMLRLDAELARAALGE